MKPSQKEIKKRYFPCPICKGSGIIEEGESDGFMKYSPDIECGWCEGEGMVEIKGRIHKKMRAFNIGMQILTFQKEPWELDGKEIQRLGEKALNLLQQEGR